MEKAILRLAGGLMLPAGDRAMRRTPLRDCGAEPGVAGVLASLPISRRLTCAAGAAPLCSEPKLSRLDGLVRDDRSRGDARRANVRLAAELVPPVALLLLLLLLGSMWEWSVRKDEPTEERPSPSEPSPAEEWPASS